MLARKHRCATLEWMQCAEDVDLHQHTPVCLPPKDFTWEAKEAWVYGWGLTKHLRRNASTEERMIAQSDVLKEGKKAIIECNPENVPPMFAINSTDVICGKPKPNELAQGDSGSPLTVEENGRHVQLGIVSSSQTVFGILVNTKYCTRKNHKLILNYSLLEAV